MNSNHKDIIYTAIDRLDEKLPGATTHIRNGYKKIEISYQGKIYEFDLIVRNSLANQSAFNTLIKAIPIKKHGKPILLIVESLTKSLAYLLKRNRINFLDISGNMFMQTQDFFVFVLDSFSMQKKSPHKPGTLFYATGLKIIFNALIYPEILECTQRDIAAICGVSLGSVSKVIKDLKKSAFLVSFKNGNRKLLNKERLVGLWIDGYSLNLRPRLLKGRYRFANRSMMRKWRDYPLERFQSSFWGGEAAADLYTGYLNPEKLTIYTDNRVLNIMKALKLVPDNNGQVEILRTFWDLDYHQKHDFLSLAHQVNRPVAPIFLVYSDLVISKDDRNFEVANMLYEKYLSNLF
jgi:hypothetical protein